MYTLRDAIEGRTVESPRGIWAYISVGCKRETQLQLLQQWSDTPAKGLTMHISGHMCIKEEGTTKRQSLSTSNNSESIPRVAENWFGK